MSNPPQPPDDWASLREPPDPPRHPARNRGTHAAPPSALRSLIKSFFAIAIVAGGVALLLHVRGNPGDHASNAAVVVSPTAAAASVTPAPTPSPTRRPSPGPTARPTPSLSPPAPPVRQPTAMAPLLVLNNSRISGLAARGAAKFRAGGWTIADVGNFNGLIPETTVYFTPGHPREHQAALHLRRQFPAVTRVRQRFPGLPGTGLTVVLTRSFPA